MSQQDSLCPECGLISWSGHRCAAILEGEEHMNPQPKALVLADALEELDVQFSHTGLCGEAADELRRLHEVNQDLLKALNTILNICLLDNGHWAKTIEREAHEAIAKATGEKS